MCNTASSRFNLSHCRMPASRCAALPGALLLLLIQCSALAAEAEWRVPETEHGHPDLQGLWTNPWQTPLQRPIALGNRRAYTETEALAQERRARELETARALPLDPGRPAPPRGDMVGAGADQNFEIRPIAIARVDGEYRTSLIIDPPNGRLPLRSGAMDLRDRWRAQGFGPNDGPEIRPGQERCLAAGGQIPLLYTFDATNGIDGDNPVRNIQIIQTRTHVVILSEYFSAVRIIRLGQEHSDSYGARWRGDSIARYEGDSLIIHSTHFREEQSNFFVKSSARLEITETYTPISSDELLFSYTLSDPEIYTQTVTAEIPLKRMPAEHRLYEYACHEGNYSLPSILRGARLAESLDN